MKVVVKKTDGSVAVMTFTAKYAQAAEHDVDAVVSAEIAAWTPEDQASVVSWRAVPDEAIPTDRTFRAAWTDTTKEPVVDIDMTKARGVWKTKMRTARKPKLADLDTQFMRAMESGADLTTIAAAKTALRDVTKLPGITAAASPEELKLVWPEILGAKAG